MTTVFDVFKYIDEIAPFNAAMDFDNVGILVGNEKDNVKKCIVALDITKEVVSEALDIGANLIISHHPIIFTPLKRLVEDSVPYMLAKSGISAICAHTNLDMAAFGVNSCLAKVLEIENTVALSLYKTEKGELPMGLVGDLCKPYSCDEFSKFVKEKLNCKGIRYTTTERKIKRVALCSGAGGDLIGEVINKNADAFITGEIKHHEILLAGENDICVVDAGHFKTEDVVVLPLVNKLSEKFDSVEFIKSSVCTDKINYIL